MKEMFMIVIDTPPLWSTQRKKPLFEAIFLFQVVQKCVFYILFFW